MNQENCTSHKAGSALPKRVPYYLARLMSPAQVGQATAGYAAAVQEQIKGRWFLCGDVNADCYAALSRNVPDQVMVRLTVFATPAGAAYAVISHQLSESTHRFVLPLYEPKVASFLDAVQAEPLGFLLGNDGHRDALVLPSEFRGIDFKPVAEMAKQQVSTEHGDRLGDLAFAIAALLRPEQVPSQFRDTEVSDVSVSVVLPTEVVVREFLEGRRQYASGARG